MQKEIKYLYYDEDLKLEAYRFEGIARPFPNHFHDYYVIGFVEQGKRILSCRNTEYTISAGDILLFNPNDNHGCTQCDGKALDYRGINIPVSTMRAFVCEITGKNYSLAFPKNVIKDDELQKYLKELHNLIMADSEKLEKEEALYIFISILIERYSQLFVSCNSDCSDKINAVCDFIESNYTKHISLEELCEYSKLSKSTLIREFTKSKGITPYRYLQSVRISNAKTLLEAGVSPADTALQTGFSDQAHLTNFFHMHIGISPAAYQRIFKRNNKNGN